MRVLTASSVISSSGKGGLEVVTLLAEVLLKQQAPSSLLALQPLRLAVLKAMARDSAVLPALYRCDSAQGRYCFQALVTSAAGDPSEECRRAARATLEAADVTADMMVPILNAATVAVMQQRQNPDSMEVVNPTPSKKRAKAVTHSKQPASSATALADSHALQFHSLEEYLASAIMVLELLQWKSRVSEPEAVLKAVQELIVQLWPLVGSISVPTEGEREEVGEEEEREVAIKQQLPSSSSIRTPYPSSLAGYTVQLALSGMEALLREHTADSAAAAAASSRASLLSSVHPALAVKAAQDAPDSALRNAALSLVSLLAGLMPQAVLEHVLQVTHPEGQYLRVRTS
jgi:hypothetical protein